MSYINKFKLKAWEKAYWFFAQQDCLDSQCEFYAKQFEQFALENLEGLGENITLADLFSDFLSDIQFAEQVETEKERSLYNV